MKILHTADWHLGKRLENFSRIEEQREVMQEIVNIANNQNVDVVIIAGDLYDTYSPSNEAIELFYKTLKQLSNNGKRAVIAIAGNHDSPERIAAPTPLARECGIILIGYPNTAIAPFQLDTGLAVTRSEPGFVEVKLPNIDTPLRLITTPYANEFRLKTYLGGNEQESEVQLRDLLRQKWMELANKHCDNKGINVLIAHLFFTKKGSKLPLEEPEGEKPILHIGGAQAIYTEDIPEQMQYVALGHLHRKQIVDNQPCPVVYSSSPLAYSFAESGQQKYTMLVELQPDKPAMMLPITLAKGRPLIRKKFTNVEDAIYWLSQHPSIWIELTLYTETYLTGTDRKRLHDVHKGIVNIIPIIKQEGDLGTMSTEMDIQRSMEELFVDFFKFKKAQEPNEEIMTIFKEILSQDKLEN